MQRHPGTDPPPFTTTIEEIIGDTLLFEETHCYPRGGGQPGDTGLIRLEDGSSATLEEVLPGEMIIHPVDKIEMFSIGLEHVAETRTIKRRYAYNKIR